MVDGNRLGAVGFEKLGTPYSEMDCQAFVEWCLKQCGLKKDLAGSNAWYREVKENGVILTPEECVKQLGCVPMGAFLFIHAYDGGEEKRGYYDSLGNASHIGICTGTRGKGAIASSASRGYVAESEFHGKSIKGGWNKVGLYNKVAYDYGTGTDPLNPVEPHPVLTPDDEPENIATIGNVPAGNRQDVNLRTRPSVLSKLIDRIPCGDTVEVLDYDDTWSRVRWDKQTGYVMTKFLLFEEAPDDDRWTVIIPDVTTEEKDALMGLYPQAAAEKGRG